MTHETNPTPDVCLQVWRHGDSLTRAVAMPARELFNFQKPGQTFQSLYYAVYDAVKECGACCRSDLALIPAFSDYSLWQLQRALETAQLHGYLKVVGKVPASHPDTPSDLDDPEAYWPLIYDVDPAGPLLDRSDTKALVQRAVRARPALQQVWSSCTPSPN